MSPERLRVALCVAIVVSLASAPLVGCGGSGAEGEASKKQSYGQILHGLERAALAGDTYRAARRAHDLDGAERAMIEELCDFAWEMKVNRETYKLDEQAYVLARLAEGAKFEMEKPDPAAIERALDELRAVIDVAGLDGRLVQSYSRACYA